MGYRPILVVFIYTERDEAIKLCDNSRFWFSFIILNRTRPLSHVMTADFGFLHRC